MWAWLASRVLRNRIAILVGVAGMTVFMGWQATKVQMNYKHGGLLPKTDSAYVDYERFLRTFSEDGNVIVIATRGAELYSTGNFAAWAQLGRDLRDMEGIDSVFSEASLFNLVRNDSLKRFDLEPLVRELPTTQVAMDSLKALIRTLPFYQGLLYNDATDASLMMVFVDAKLFNTEARVDVVKALEARINAFRSDTGVETHVSGLPWIRVKNTLLVKGEMPLFMAASMGVCALLLLLFFRSWRVMAICMGVVAVSVVWVFGCMAMLGYGITVLQAVIGPLIIVTGVPNCVFLINAYHYEYVAHRNKIKSLQRVISRIGAAAFMTNATTAVGFTTFCVTYSSALVEFGWTATIGIMVLWALSMLLIPILCSVMPPPKPRHLSHLERRWLDKAVEWIVATTQRRRPLIYTITAVVTIAACVGILRMKDLSRLVDDLPENDPVLTDLKFFEDNFRGVMPMEVMVETDQRGGVFKDATLKRLERLGDTLATYPEFSRSLSIVDAVKFTKQAFYGGDPAKYELLKGAEKSFIAPYLEGLAAGAGDDRSARMGKAFIDSTRSTARLTVQMADVGTVRMEELVDRLRTHADSIFDPGRYKVVFTGTCIVFLKGSSYLVSNLITSLFWAIVIIVALMAVLFNSLRILIVALLPNIIPLIVTAGIMGFAGIPIKPSTMLVFGIALGIAVDNAIHLLARYRIEVKLTGGDLKLSVDRAVREVSVGIIYTSVVLLAGFGLFGFSHFGGIKAMGILTTVTLLVAMLTNLLVLPSLILSLNRHLMSRAFQEPLLEILDEDDDIELGYLRMEDPRPGDDVLRSTPPKHNA